MWGLTILVVAQLCIIFCILLSLLPWCERIIPLFLKIVSISVIVGIFGGMIAIIEMIIAILSFIF